jgi:putative peptidoglycan lipid II flippase
MNHFASPAFGPVFLNIALIASAVWLCPKIGVMGLVIGVLAGGVLQLGLSMPFLYRRGIRIDFQEGFRHASVARIGRLLVPRAVGSAVYQINIFVDTILASLAWIVGQGGVAALYYANRLIQFPLGIFGIALAQAALPKMSQEFAQDDITSFKDTLCFSLRIVSLIMIPAGFGLAILGRPIIRLLFERGEFTPYSTSITQDALFYYSFGMLAYAGIKLLVSAFYSMHDTMTPVKTASAAVILNIILNVVLMFPLKLGGLALATSISAMSNFVMLFLLLRKRIGDFGSRRIADSFLRAVMASLVMSAVLICFIIACGSFGFLELAVSILAGGVAFILAGYIFGITEIRDFIVWIIKRR